MNNHTHTFPSRPVMSVEEFLKWAGISRWLFYKLVKEGKIHPKKIGARTVILVEEAERWLRELPDANPFPAPPASSGQE